MRTIILGFIFSVFTALGASHCIREAAVGAGTGADWTDAWTDLPANFVRGDTYYVAGGSYGGHNCYTSESGSALVSIKKATVADHGTDTGWDNAYGTAQATFTDVLSFSTGYWLWDGQTRNAGWTNGYGFRFLINGNNKDIIKIGDSGSITNVTIRLTEIDGGVMDATHVNDAVYAEQTDDDTITIQECWTHNVWFNSMMIKGHNYLIESNFFDRNESTTILHGQSIQDDKTENCVVRFNIFREPRGTAVWTVIGSHGAVVNCYFYGNVVWYPQDYTSDNMIASALIEVISGSVVSNFFVYNNTVYNHHYLGPRLTQADATGNGRVAYNNLFFNCASTAGGDANWTKDYNYYYNSTHDAEAHEELGVQTILLNTNTYDFHLTGHTTAGTVLGAPFNVDFDGKTRTTFDRGAYEYQSPAHAGTAITVHAGTIQRP